jgi:hypothetical protein
MLVWARLQSVVIWFCQPYFSVTAQTSRFSKVCLSRPRPFRKIIVPGVVKKLLAVQIYFYEFSC